jgi:hypothetical protein
VQIDKDWVAKDLQFTTTVDQLRNSPNLRATQGWPARTRRRRRATTPQLT